MGSIINDLPAPGEKVWYIIRSDAHEGPYGLEDLRSKLVQQELAADAQVWARGWPEPLSLMRVLNAYEPQPKRKIKIKRQARTNAAADGQLAQAPSITHGRWWFVIVLMGLGISGWMLSALTPLGQLGRPTEMPLASFRQMDNEFRKLSARVPVARLIVAPDYSKIWLLDKSDQQCHYQAQFFSREEENLSGKTIAFQTEGSSAQHWIVLDRLSFQEGQKLLPGRYELKLNRQSCRALGLQSWWQPADPDLALAFKVVLFYGEEHELTRQLDELRAKRLAAQKAREHFTVDAWKEVAEKIRTLDAIAAQILQNFQALLDRQLAWPARFQRVLDQYTVRFGGFLGQFMTKNDEDFTILAGQELPLKSELMARQAVINGFAKSLGQRSMLFIEEFQPPKPIPERRKLQEALMKIEQDIGVEREKMRLAIEEVQQYSPAP